MRRAIQAAKRSNLLVVVTMVVLATHGQAQSTALEPEVRSQIDLLSAWLEGQLEIRGLPGVVVGVVSGED